MSGPAPTSPVPPTNTPPTPNPPAHPLGPVPGKVLLGIAATLFVGWLGWLTFTALTKSKAPTVSRAQAAASFPVRAELTAGAADKPAQLVKVKEQLTPNGPTAGTEMFVKNLPECSGYSGPGEYLLLLHRDEEAALDGKLVYWLTGQQRSPGENLEVGSPRVYPWSEDVAKQVKRLYP